MVLALALALLLTGPSFAQDVPLRPLTYSLDPKLSEGPIANFLELYVNPETFVKELKAAKPPAPPVVEVSTEAPGEAPSEGGPSEEGAATEAPAAPAVKPAVSPAVNVPPTGNLLVLNDRGSWADVSVNGSKVGKIGPHIYGVIGPVPSGTYDLSLTYANGYVWTGEVATSQGEPPGAFGGAPSSLPHPDGSHTTKLRKK